MSTHRVVEVRRASTDRILSGEAPGPRLLVEVLRGAAAPPTPREFAGEPDALASFRAQRSSLVISPRKPARRNPMFAKAFVGGVVAVAVSGGVALAAATHNGSHPSAARSVEHAVSPTASSAAPAKQPVAAPKLDAKPSTSRPSEPRTVSTKPAESAPRGTPAPSLTGLCIAYQAGVAENPGKALDNPAFAPLITAAKGKEKVSAYCATKLGNAASHANGAPSTHPNNRPPARPSGSPVRPRPTVPVGPLASAPPGAH